MQASIDVARNLFLEALFYFLLFLPFVHQLFFSFLAVFFCLFLQIHLWRICVRPIHRVSKNSQNCFWHNFVKISPTLIILAQRCQWRHHYVRFTQLPPHLIYVNTLPCETQMLQIVTLRGDYLYLMAHLCVINSAVGATWFNNFEVLNI